MTAPISIKDLRISLQLSQFEMSDLLGLSNSHYSMVEGGRRNLPGPSLIRVLTIQKILKEYVPAQKETTSSTIDFLLSELRSWASITNLAQKRLQKKEKVEANSVQAWEWLDYLLTHFDLLAPSSTDPEMDRVWKEAMKSKTQKPNPEETELASIKNRIESECMALRIRLIQEEMEAVQKSS